MHKKITIALDAMSGDHGLEVVSAAALAILKVRSDVSLILVGDEQKIQAYLQKRGAYPLTNLSIQHASQSVDMDEPPAQALRNKKDSSMRVAIDLVKAGTADACVSAGNTGALMATARFVLKMLPGIDRPAIITKLPSIEGHSHVLDLGANVDCTAEHLFQFAIMGSELVTAVEGIERPRVSLLNIGEEAIKGNDQVKQAATLLAESQLNYIGFMEGDDIYKGGSDVVVCDGFVGNVALKSSEGVAKMIAYLIKKEFNRNLLTRLAGLIAMPVLKALKSRIDPRHYNGASLLGLRGIVIKSHGSADELAFANAIHIAITEVDKAVPQRISARLEVLLTKKSEN